MKKHLKIGYLQQHNIADTKTNILRLAAGIKDLANRGADWWCCRNSTTRSTSAKWKM